MAQTDPDAPLGIPIVLIPTILSIVVFGSLLFLVGFIVFLSLRHAARNQQMRHDERLAAISAGLPWEDPNIEENRQLAKSNMFWIAFWIVVCGCFIPFIAVGANLQTSFFQNSTNAIAAWLTAALASVTASICGTILMVKGNRNSSQRSSPGDL